MELILVGLKAETSQSDPPMPLRWSGSLTFRLPSWVNCFLQSSKRQVNGLATR